jgi:phage tail-like protein
VTGRVYVVAQVGDQAFALDATLPGDGSLALTPAATYLPMRLFGGRGIEAAAGTVYYDFADTGTWLPLVEQRRPRYVESATIVTRVLDGGDPDCVWHRLFLDMSLPDETAVLVSSRAANDLADLAHGAWLAEPPRLSQRSDGSEIPFAPVVGKHATWELLFQNPVGRYLQLQLTLQGNRRASPRIRALRAYYPRFSYMTYLPAVYRDSDTSGFLERFLANPESFFTPIEDRIASVQVLFDPTGTPADATAWLASWFGIAVDPSWEDFRRRLLIRNAMTLFQYRGTRRGLQMALELLLDPRPDDSIFTRDEDTTPGGIRILEAFATRWTAGKLAASAPAAGGIVATTPVAQWTPLQGGAVLLAAYQAFVGQPVTAFPISAPADAATAALWTSFTASALGFVPVTPGPQDRYAWPGFLRRRYRRLGALSTAYGASPAFTSWESVPLPTSLPIDGPQLVDWFQFQGVVMPVRRAAHRFTVVLPVPVSALGDAAAQATHADLARRMIDLEKPAHTLYDVRFTWALFRVGQVRLGIDTTVDRGSRAPELMPAMVLGQGYLSEGHVAPAPPESALDRTILGRDQLPGASRRRR